MCIKATKRFLKSAAHSCLPKKIGEQLPIVIREIGESHPVDACKIKKGGFWRTRITRNYRLFYRYDNGCLCLLDLRRRNEHTYQGVELLDRASILSILEDDAGDEERASLLTVEQLVSCNIPSRYHHRLLAIRDEDELLNLDDKLDYKFIALIIDTLHLPTIDDISKEAFYEIDDLDNLVENCRSGRINQFLLALSDEQKNIVSSPVSDRPILVKGGPGTGKSILAIHRVKQLIDWGKRRILFTTHNETLVNYFNQLLQDLVPEAIADSRVKISTVDDIVKEYNSKSEALIASQEISKLCLISVMRTIDISHNIKDRLWRLGYLSILQEILGIIESRGIDEDRYLKVSRIGVGEPNKRSLRQAIWHIYQEWSLLLQKSGYTTIEQSRKQALNIVDRMTAKPYDAVIIDELQDLSPTSIRLLVRLVESPSDLFLTADTSQSLHERVFCWNYIQQEINCRSKVVTLTKSFRNTREITKACPDILVSQYDRKNIVKESSLLSGRRPKLILTDRIVQYSQLIIDHFINAAQRWNLPLFSGVILVPNELMGLFITAQLNHFFMTQTRFTKLRAKWLDNTIDALPEDSYYYIKVLSFHAVKGLEFPFVAILGLEENVFPQSFADCESEDIKELLNQQRRLFYVACSRAMRALLVIGSKSKPSCLIKDFQRLEQQNWKIEEK